MLVRLIWVLTGIRDSWYKMKVLLKTIGPLFDHIQSFYWKCHNYESLFGTSLKCTVRPWKLLILSTFCVTSFILTDGTDLVWPYTNLKQAALSHTFLKLRFKESCQKFNQTSHEKLSRRSFKSPIIHNAKPESIKHTHNNSNTIKIIISTITNQQQQHFSS